MRNLEGMSSSWISALCSCQWSSLVGSRRIVRSLPLHFLRQFPYDFFYMNHVFNCKLVHRAVMSTVYFCLAPVLNVYNL